MSQTDACIGRFHHLGVALDLGRRPNWLAVPVRDVEWRIEWVKLYEGLHLATGGSGHCFKLGPAIGELVANAIIAKPSSFASVETFSLSRFAENCALTSSYGGNRA